MVLITIVTGANLNQQTSLGGLTLYQSKLRIITIVGPALLRQGSNMPAKRRPRMATAVFTVDIDPRLRLNKCWLWEYIWSSYIAFIYIYIYIIYVPFIYHLYSGWWCNNHLEKYEFVNGKDDISYIMENNKCLKPPTSNKMQ